MDILTPNVLSHSVGNTLLFVLILLRPSPPPPPPPPPPLLPLGLKPIDVNNTVHWIEIDPSQNRFHHELRLKAALLGDPTGPYFHTVAAAEKGTAGAQAEALYMVLAELIAMQRSSSSSSNGSRGREVRCEHAFVYNNTVVNDANDDHQGDTNGTDSLTTVRKSSDIIFLSFSLPLSRSCCKHTRVQF